MNPDIPGGRTRAAIYLDHAAATPLEAEVAAAMDEVRAAGFANPSSPHAAGRQARRLLEEARERILAVCGGDLGEGARLVFTSGATEANRLGVLGMAAAVAAGRRGRILSSARDHASLRAAAAELAARGWEAVTVPLDAAGGLAACPGGAAADADVEILCATLACGQSASWDTLAVLEAWAGGGARRRVHVDATQAFVAAGPGPFGLPPGVAATVAFAPHKFGGPRGIGALVVGRQVSLVPHAPGPQEAGLRGGTEAVDLAWGFALAVELATADRTARARRLEELRDRLADRLRTAAAAAGIAARVVAADARRAPHIATLAFAGIDRQAFVMAADLEGVCCATGTACASGASEPSPALEAMGLPTVEVAGAVRFSVGATTTAADVDEAADRLARVFTRLATAGGSPR